MSASALCLLGYAGWAMILVILIASRRSVLTVLGKRAANSFSPTGDDISPLTARLTRAHANTLENLPIATAILLAAIATHHTDVTDTLAPFLLGARVLQSGVHLASTSVPAVMVRFTFFGVQLGIQIVWVVGLLRA